MVPDRAVKTRSPNTGYSGRRIAAAIGIKLSEVPA
jgi:hypothetical protein